MLLGAFGVLVLSTYWHGAFCEGGPCKRATFDLLVTGVGGGTAMALGLGTAGLIYGQTGRGNRRVVFWVALASLALTVALALADAVENFPNEATLTALPSISPPSTE